MKNSVAEKIESKEEYKFDYILNYLDKELGLLKAMDKEDLIRLKNKMDDNFSELETKKFEFSFNLKPYDPAGITKELSKTEKTKLSNKKLCSVNDVQKLRKCTYAEAEELYSSSATINIPFVKYEKEGEMKMIADIRNIKYTNTLNNKDINAYLGKGGKAFNLQKIKALMVGKTVLKKDVPIYVKGLDGKNHPRLGEDGKQILANYWVGFNKKDDSFVTKNDYYLGIVSKQKIADRNLSPAQLIRLSEGKSLILPSLKNPKIYENYAVNVFMKDCVSTPKTRALLKEKLEKEQEQKTGKSKSRSI